MVSRCCNVVSEQWKLVTVEKRDKQGKVIVDKENGGREWTYLQDCRSGDLYWNENSLVIATKCALVALFAPIYTLGVMNWNFRRIFIDTARVAFSTLSEIGKNWNQKWGFLQLKGRELYQRVSTDIWNIVRSPIYMLGVMFTALYGIVNPYEGRRCEAMVEHAWQHEVSYRKDYRHAEGWIDGLFEAQAFYFAYCFQVRHNINDPDIRVLK